MLEQEIGEAAFVFGQVVIRIQGPLGEGLVQDRVRHLANLIFSFLKSDVHYSARFVKLSRLCLQASVARTILDLAHALGRYRPRPLLVGGLLQRPRKTSPAPSATEYSERMLSGCYRFITVIRIERCPFCDSAIVQICTIGASFARAELGGFLII